MATFEFGPGEEKLAQAYVLIAALQADVAQLMTRIKIDSVMLDVLVATHPKPEAVSLLWEKSLLEYYPSESLQTFGAVDRPRCREELNRRIEALRGLLEAARASRTDD